MNFGHISPEGWIEFERRHAAAYDFLLRESLNGEHTYLIKKNASSVILSDWESARLVELEEWAKRA